MLQVREVLVDGSTLLPKDEISNEALASLGGSYGGIIPHTSILFFPDSEIHEAVSTKFKEIQDFTIHRSGFDSLTISLAEREPAAIVCAGFREESTRDDCYWSDKHGYIFASTASSAASYNEEAFDHFYVPADSGEVKPGKNFVEENLFNDLLNFIHGATKAGLEPLGLLVGENGEYEMYIKNKKGDTEATVSFDNKAPLDTMLSNLLVFWENSNSTKKATSTPAYDYINLRFGNTVYYSPQ